MSKFQSIDMAKLRSGNGVKWGDNDDQTLCAWVADMDFGVPEPVKAAMKSLVDNEDFGYPRWPDGDPVINAFESRMKKHFDWAPIPDRTKVLSDLIQILQITIELTTQPGDAIALHLPCYPPFLNCVSQSGRKIIPLELKIVDGYWKYDHSKLLETLRQNNVKLMLLINPQNPTGRVFTKSELTQIADACKIIDIPIFSDEIHSDLIFDNNVHIPIASINEDAAARTITTTSATKSFNIAGTRCAVVHFGHEETFNKFNKFPTDFFGAPNTIAKIATAVAWTECEDWFTELMITLKHNRELLTSWATSHDLPYVAPEGTYLGWFDLGKTRIGSEPEAQVALLEKSKVRLGVGSDFSQFTELDTHSWVRINLATSTSNLEEILKRITAQL